MFALCFMVVTILVVECTAQTDPCSPGNHQEINDYRRSSGYSGTYHEEPVCDFELATGWYRFTSQAGGEMPTSKVGRLKCGTFVPIWMRGEHPSVGEGEVNKVACANFEIGGPQQSDGCELEFSIAVKNCGTFYVYHLQPAPGCPMAYCAGDRVCQAGRLTPNCIDSYPRLTTPPVLSGPEIVGSTFRFVCQFDFSPQDPLQAFEVAWTFEGVTNVTKELRDPQRVAYLNGTELQGNLGKNLGCKVRAFYTNNPQQKGLWLESNVYWVGVRPEVTHLTISKEDELRYVTLTSTVPVICDDIQDDELCCLSIDLKVNGDARRLQAGLACRWPMCRSMWDDTKKEASVTIPLTANRDQINQPFFDLLLKFNKLRPNRTHGSYMMAFEDFEISPVQIEVLDAETKTCSLSSDPHFSGLNGNYFDLYRVGDFTIYENVNRHFEVQIRTWPCWADHATCACAVAIREKDNYIVIDGCDNSFYANGGASPEIKQTTRIFEGVSLRQASDGSQIAVYFPSGSEILVVSRNGGSPGYYYMDVTLKVPAMDKGHGRGICGTFDGDNTNEFTRRDGTVDTMCSGCEPVPFLQSWMNDHAGSLFRAKPPLLNSLQLNRYCVCAEQNNTGCNVLPPGTLSCTPNCRPIPTIGTPGQGGIEDQLALQNGPQKIPGRRRRDVPVPTFLDADDATYTYDPDDYKDFVPKRRDWTVPRQITETEARLRCRQALEGSAIWPFCKDNFGNEADISIGHCVTDVKIGDTFDGAVDSMIESFTTVCQVELAKDLNNYQTNPETGESVMKAEITTDICSTICLLHGRCGKGVCVCDAGFTGDNCQLPANQPPVLRKIRGSSFCDTSAQPCQKIFIDAAYIQMKETLACKVWEILHNGSVSKPASMEEAVFLTAGKLSCELPNTRRSVAKFMVSVTVDGATYSNELNLTVFDSTCQNCTETGCVQLLNTCVINDQCYRGGDSNPDNSVQVCAPETNTSQWTNLYPQVNVRLSGPNDGETMVCSVQTSETSPLARYKVSWYVDGFPFAFPIETHLPGRQTQAFYSIYDLPGSGQLVCKIRSYFSDRNTDSPYQTSNAVDLAGIERNTDINLSARRKRELHHVQEPRVISDHDTIFRKLFRGI